MFSNDNIIWTSAVSVVEKVAMTSAMFEQAFSIIIYSISYSIDCKGEPWSVVIRRRWTHAWTPPRAQGSLSFQRPSARLRVRIGPGRGCPGLSAEQLATPLPPRFTVQRE
jgi:hypothetical protein